MSTKTSENVDFGTSTSVSGDWQGVDYDALHVDVAPASALLVVIVGDEVRLHEKIGGDEARRFLDRCVKRVVHAADSFDGRAVEDVGGEIFAEFERADDALKAALEMLRRVADLPPVSGLKLGLRIGFSYGLIADNSALSSCEVAKTARSLAALARPGQVAACIRAQSALSPQILARYDAHCQELLLSESVPAFAPARPFVPAELAMCDESLRHKGLLLKYGGNIYVLDDVNEEIRIGRDDENHVILRGRHASRFHATIKRRGNEIVLIDTSTNGTFVSLKDEAPHLLLIQRECVLRGCGVLSFSTADPSSGIGTASARFEVL